MRPRTWRGWTAVRRPGVSSPRLIEELHPSPQVGDDDRAADDEGDVEGFEKLFIGDAAGNAPIDVIGDAVITAEDHGGDEAEKLLGFAGKFAVFVARAIKAEESFHVECGADGAGCGGGCRGRISIGGSTEDARIHACAICLKLLVSILVIVRWRWRCGHARMVANRG